MCTANVCAPTLRKGNGTGASDGYFPVDEHDQVVPH